MRGPLRQELLNSATKISTTYIFLMTAPAILAALEEHLALWKARVPVRTAAAHFVAVVLGDYTLWMSFCLRMYLARSMTSEGPSAPSVIVMGGSRMQNEGVCCSVRGDECPCNEGRGGPRVFLKPPRSISLSLSRSRSLPHSAEQKFSSSELQLWQSARGTRKGEKLERFSGY